MATYGLTADGAFDILVWRPQEINIRVREFAQRLLAAMVKSMPADTRTRVDHILLGIK